jgi:hypothetical protein
LHVRLCADSRDYRGGVTGAATAAEPTLARLRQGLVAMRNYLGNSPGKVGHVDAGGVSR